LLIPARKNKEVVMALREIAAGEVTFANIIDLPKTEEDLEAGETEADETTSQAEVEAA
jgi:hypothetical protein